MIRFETLREIAQRVGEFRLGRRREPRINCVDCPIVMQCGLEPQEKCLGKLEAIAAGRRREVGPWDTGRIEIGV
jgi:hypothetical protein